METKLTLKLQKEIIDRAKKYAANQNISISRLVEAYLQSITSENSLKEAEISPYVKSLSTGVKIPKDLDHKKEYADHLLKKYK